MSAILLCAVLSNSSDSDSGITEPIEKTAMPSLVRGSGNFVTPGKEECTPGHLPCALVRDR